MQSFGQDVRRAEERRYLAERRKIYGNAVSNNNMRNHPPVAEVPSFPVQPPPPISAQNSAHGSLGARNEVSLASAFSWQLGRCLHVVKPPVRRISPDPLSKEMRTWPVVPDVPDNQVRWCTVPEYEKLQKEALDKAKMANNRVDED